MDFSKLKEPFPAKDIEWRLQSCGEKNGKFWGKALAYITSRAVQDRLDEVCGPENWKTSIEKTGDTYLCTLSIRVKREDGTYEWLSRTDGADATDIEPVKGGISGAIKRAAVLFGIGRYLYNLEEGWAVVSEDGKLTGCTKEKKYFKWNPPELPAWALPGGSGKPDNEKPNSPSQNDLKKAEEIKTILVTYEGIIPDERWTSINTAVTQGNVKYLNEILNWCKKEAEKQSA